MTRILHVSDVYRPQIAGIELFVEELAQQQRAVGHEVTVLTSASGSDGAAPEEHVIRGSMLTLAGKVDFADYDVVHAHISVFSSASTLVTRAAVRAGTPVVATVHSMWAGPGSLFVPTAARIGGWRRAPIVWAAVSRAAAQDVRRALPDAEVHVVPNAVDVDWWRAGRAPVGSASGPLIIAAVMRLARRKRPLALIDAIDRVREQVAVPFRLVIAGDGPQRHRCEVAIRVRGLDDVVELAGPLPRKGVRSLYARSDVYAAPATLESFGLAALEARSVGLPVVGMRAGGVGEFLADGVDGVLCRDDIELAGALTVLLRDEDVRSRMTTHNRAVRPVHDWAHAVANYDAAYVRAAELAERPFAGVFR